MSIVQSGVFLFSFRYVFGGAIHTGSTSYVDYLVPAYVATIVLLADSSTNVWSILTTAALGFAFGFRLPGTGADALAAFGLCLVYAVVFTVVFIVMGLFAPNAQAAQGMSLIAFVFAFISSAYVPAASMPGWLQPFSRYQPITPMVNAVRALLTGSSSDVGLALAWSGLLVLIWHADSGAPLPPGIAWKQAEGGPHARRADAAQH